MPLTTTGTSVSRCCHIRETNALPTNATLSHYPIVPAPRQLAHRMRRELRRDIGTLQWRPTRQQVEQRTPYANAARLGRAGMTELCRFGHGHTSTAE
jgi:hypothetical protein